MAGNVSQWCWDWYGSYPTGPQTDPSGAGSGTNRVLRGGGWKVNTSKIGSAYRVYLMTPQSRDYDIGFRVACLQF